jgi:ribosomal protein S4E
MNGQEAKMICRERFAKDNRAGNILVDNRVRKDPKFPLGLMGKPPLP